MSQIGSVNTTKIMLVITTPGSFDIVNYYFCNACN